MEQKIRYNGEVEPISAGVARSFYWKSDTVVAREGRSVLATVSSPCDCLHSRFNADRPFRVFV